MQTARLFVFVAFAFATACAVPASAQTPAGKPVTVISGGRSGPSAVVWKEDTFSFGNVNKGRAVSHDFTFKNTTKQTILITGVQSSCACVTTKHTTSPIKPGDTGTVTATHNGTGPGAFTKTLTVTTNDSDVNKVLTVKGTVVEAKR